MVDKGITQSHPENTDVSGLGLESYTSRAAIVRVSRGGQWGVRICQVNGRSDEMYILLSGQFGFYNEAQILLANIDPVAPVGKWA